MSTFSYKYYRYFPTRLFGEAGYSSCRPQGKNGIKRDINGAGKAPPYRPVWVKESVDAMDGDHQLSRILIPSKTAASSLKTDSYR